jgi:hypothetical protein
MIHKETRIFLHLIDLILCSKCNYPKKEMGHLAATPPSFLKFSSLHLLGSIGDRGTSIETAKSMIFFLNLLLLYFQCTVINATSISDQMFAQLDAIQKRITKLDAEQQNAELWGCLSRLEAQIRIFV